MIKPIGHLKPGDTVVFPDGTHHEVASVTRFADGSGILRTLTPTGGEEADEVSLIEEVVVMP